jgi:heterotetrameric sarcosine oxidase gamma subunit
MSTARIEPIGPERLVAIDGDVPDGALAGLSTLRLGPREHLVLDAEASALPPLGGALAIDVGDAHEGWTLSGPGAARLLAKACTLDLALVRLGEATRTAMAGVPAILRRLDPEAWELRVDRGYAAWLEAWLRSLQDVA